MRITLGGGGTDLPSYYERLSALVLSAGINRYIYVAINRTFTVPGLSDLESRLLTGGALGTPPDAGG